MFKIYPTLSEIGRYPIDMQTLREALNIPLNIQGKKKLRPSIGIRDNLQANMHSKKWTPLLH